MELIPAESEAEGSCGKIIELRLDDTSTEGCRISGDDCTEFCMTIREALAMDGNNCEITGVAPIDLVVLGEGSDDTGIQI